ncbi:pyruvate formate-lyase-activating protein [Gracilibacillus sp. S3-1-1]|uniref:Pyruvate formate-lyase-activating protein n=1 Tax=Gracilibacillus pellucidus TaxID=3095368 RepID=A0ACC6M6G7_9BACI|nr:pyruvate formate-lyase-activating protein [Gracilibacillus sp. S3-1-1]MDX8046362.1 pyruvate formate-lyase-activating protein [Gracilibacillus sp. S3-1-1]
MIGRIHSVETCGTVDGPGLRYVIFMQGCLLRCQYCHNPDTWKRMDGKNITVEELVTDIQSYLPFFQASGGGVTVSGGEPLLQVDFLIELFTELKQLGVHTTIDSCGGCFSASPYYLEKLDTLMQVTDLVLLDLKHIDLADHIALTGMSNQHILHFAQYLDDRGVPVWIRHVLVPTISDDNEALQRLAEFIRTLHNVVKIDVLPYHKLGVYKWEELGLEYPLEGIEPPTQERINNAERILRTGLMRKKMESFQ